MGKICETVAQDLVSMDAVKNKAPDICAVDQALTIARTAYRASCGKGTFCRDGLCQLCRVVEEVAQDRGSVEDLELLQELCAAIVTAGDCQLSTAAAGLVLQSLESHWEEWREHITRRRCAALVCAPFCHVYIDPGLCTGCGQCLAAAPKGAVAGGQGLIHVVIDDRALKTPGFFQSCPAAAIKKCGPIQPPLPEGPVPVGSFTGGARRRRRGGAPAAEQ